MLIHEMVQPYLLQLIGMRPGILSELLEKDNFLSQPCNSGKFYVCSVTIGFDWGRKEIVYYLLYI